MSAEIELKLSTPPRALRDVVGLSWLRKLANGPVRRQKLISVYFDTNTYTLRNHGVTLRIRTAGRKRLQTIKAVGPGVSGRSEWEGEITSVLPNLALAKNTALAPLLSGKLKRSLRPIFETDVERTTLPLRTGDSEIELAVDRGRVRAGRRRAEISEIELELKSGTRADLARLAARLARAVPVSYGVLAKSERGYALSAGGAVQAVTAMPVVLDEDPSAGSLFATIGLSCLHHFAANEDAVRAGAPEGVHQMRVGLRRLRAAISVFKQIIADEETDTIKTELKWLTEQLGPARDLHVLIEESVAPLRQQDLDKSEVDLLVRDLEARRDQGIRIAREAVESDRYRHLVMNVALWLLDGTWLKSDDPLRIAGRERSGVAFAQDVLAARRRKVVKKTRKLKRLSVPERHKLRIAVKKLRYATEFFAGLFDGRKSGKARKRFSKHLKELQNTLGKLNDIAVHDKLARQFARSGRKDGARPEKAFAMGVLTGRERGLARNLTVDAMAAGAALSGSRPFWI